MTAAKKATEPGAAPRGPGIKLPGIEGKRSRRALLGKKVGMSQVYSEAGVLIPVTVLRAGPCTVLQVKTADSDGYAAVQLGFDDSRKQKKHPQQAQLDRLGISAKRFVREVPFVRPGDILPSSEESAPGSEPPRAKDGDDSGGPAGGGPAGDGSDGGEAAPDSEGASVTEGDVAAGGGAKLAPGVRIGVGLFKNVPRVDIRGVTKGRGFAGVIRRHRFNAGDKSHGSKNIREPKSTGMHTDPGRVHRGKRMPGHMGAVFRKARNLDVIRIDEDENLLLVKGSVPGPNGGYVYIEESLYTPRGQPTS